MALRFLADHCVSKFIVQRLREANHEVLRLGDILTVESSDAIIITKAQEIDAILLSLDGDFADIVKYPPKSYKGIVALQMRNHPEILPKLMTRLTGYLKVQPAMEQITTSYLWTLGCHGRGREFESRRPRHILQSLTRNPEC
jgi:predicted nuclease of predicted toxin-antitoxin system